MKTYVLPPRMHAGIRSGEQTQLIVMPHGAPALPGDRIHIPGHLGRKLIPDQVCLSATLLEFTWSGGLVSRVLKAGREMQDIGKFARACGYQNPRVMELDLMKAGTGRPVSQACLIQWNPAEAMMAEMA